MGQDGGYLSATSGRMMVICQLLEAGWWLSVSYTRKDVGYMSFTMRQDGGYLSVT